jgi:hypothetical protein
MPPGVCAHAAPAITSTSAAIRNFFILGDPLIKLVGRYEPIDVLLYINI